MSYSRSSSFLRRALVADAVISGTTGLLILLGAGFLDGLLGVPASLLTYAGLSLIPFAALLLYLSRQDTVSPGMVWAVIAVNSAWVVASGWLLVSGLVAPSALGYAFIILQAIAVAGFVELEYVGLRRLASGMA